MPNPPDIFNIALSALQGGRTSGFELERDAGTGVITKFKTDNTPQDNAAGLEALRLLGGGAQQHTPQKAKGPSLTLGDAIKQYFLSAGADLKRHAKKTRKQALASVEARFGTKAQVGEITRPQCADWANDLIVNGLAKRTAVKLVSNASQMFDTLVDGGHYEKNPMKGVLTMSKQDRKDRKVYAWQPFDLRTLRQIYEPQNLKRATTSHVRWAALMGLYTGARVSELAQIYLGDFKDAAEAVPYVKISNEYDGQSVKTDASHRKVPLHQDLIKLGLLERVAALDALGEKRLFPEVNLLNEAGAGAAISKGFSYLLGVLHVVPTREEARVGFHSLRKTVIQTLQGSKLPAERRRAYVGHEPDDGDVHTTDYMRDWEASELVIIKDGLKWGEWLKLDELRLLLSQSVDDIRKEQERTKRLEEARAQKKAAEAKAKAAGGKRKKKTKAGENEQA